ncbi:glycosyltransferase family 4 protein [Enterococcus devriesei]|uniref:glycosyltransferase family 4 protein n=1 Tax=Enterococcus devriesei TaxID=319970 RepID=UPI001C1227B8|nr:glycosyltransferase family 4 protein [Enterococcus devriesei]MBU5363894.1 glycosyltransferase family 4 protein [Enterococcus devriesei]
MKKILVVSQYFYPEQFRINDICETWVKRGYEVTVLTGIPNYPNGDFFEGYGLNANRKELYKGINIIRIPIVPRKKNSIMMGMNYLSFVISGFIWNLFDKNDYDCVFIYEVSPMTQALPAVRVAKKKKIPCYIYVMDLWPENFEVITGIHNSMIITSLNKMVDYIYNNCTKIFTASESFKRNIEERGISPQKVFFWPQYAEEFYIPSKKKSEKIKRDGKINVTFAGNIGEAQGLEILPEVGRVIKKEDLNIRFNLIGNGRYKEKLMAEIHDEKVEKIFSFFDPVPAKEIPEILGASDFSFVSLKKNEIFSLTIPAKLQSSMACGVPIVLSADGEVQDIINSSKSGFTSNSGDINALLENLRKISKMSKSDIEKMGILSREYFEAHFEKEKLINMMDQHLN